MCFPGDDELYGTAAGCVSSEAAVVGRAKAGLRLFIGRERRAKPSVNTWDQKVALPSPLLGDEPRQPFAGDNRPRAYSPDPWYCRFENCQSLSSEIWRMSDGRVSGHASNLLPTTIRPKIVSRPESHVGMWTPLVTCRPGPRPPAIVETEAERDSRLT